MESKKSKKHSKKAAKKAEKEIVKEEEPTQGEVVETTEGMILFLVILT